MDGCHPVKVYAFIPARAGSRRVESKNLREVDGMSLVSRAIRAADQAGCWVVVSSDSAAIRNHAREEGADDMHERPPALASDHAQIEAAVSHWYTRLDSKPDVIVILQPTSPFRTARHVKEALRLLEATGADSVIGVTASHDSHFAGRLKPREVGNGLCAGEPWFEWQPHAPMGHDRPRTQDLPPRGTDNGSLYVTRRKAWETSELRTSGVTVALPMSRIEGWDIDTIEELDCARAIAERFGI
jgi:CMP-N,N'-diacetyllegionaminic acid synthase